MQKQLKDVMTPNVKVAGPQTSVREIASIMKDEDVGLVPICDGEKLIGVVTDRDIVLRSMVQMKNPDTTTANDIMTREVVYLFDSQDTLEAARLMEKKQIRRLVVLNDEKRLAGIVSLGDLTCHGNQQMAGTVLNQVSRHPDQILQ